MKKNTNKFLMFVLVAAVSVAVFLIGFFYMRFVSKTIYNDSTKQLKETYDIVRRSTRSYIEQKWRVLNDWKDDVTEPDFDFGTRNLEWRFYNFYFLHYSAGDTEVDYVAPSYTIPATPDTEQKDKPRYNGKIAYDDDWKELFENGGKIVTGGETDYGEKITVFAITVDAAVPHTYAPEGEEPFEYNAIGISFRNKEVAYALSTNPYDGQANCYIIHADGRGLFAMEDGDGNFINLLDFLVKGMDADRDDVDRLGKALLDGVKTDDNITEEYLMDCSINGENNCVYYQRLGYQDYYIISIVPQSVISSSFLSVQHNTTIVFVIIFVIIGAAAITIFIILAYRQSKKTNFELKYRDQMFNVLSNSVDDIFIMLDAVTQSVDYLSPNIGKLLGISVKDAKADMRNVAKCAIDHNIIVPKEELAAIPVNGSKFWECEYRHMTTGERRWYRVTIYHMEIQGIKKYIIVMSDRTVEKQMNQNLKEAFAAAKSANEAKSNFLSNMSHDIRTPMNAIVGFSVLLEKDADDPEKVREYTRKITASGHHLLSIINDVLDMSKIENGKTSLNLETFDLPGFLEEMNIIIMPQAKAKMQEFSITVKGNPPEKIIGDKLRLNRILMNILSNAVKYTPEGGKISFSVTNIPQTSSQIAKLRFTVTDNGIGISEEYQKQIFQPFTREINSVTNKVQGTGLGMAITKSLVDLMGGIISVESTPGKGSTFVVELSFSLADKEETEAWFRQKVRRVLVADDEKDICDSIKEVMSDTGVDIECVYSGGDAVKAAVAAHEAGNDFDVILLDWKMPEMDGVETARNIRSQTRKDVPILVLTSYDWADIEVEARKAGINAFMSKPFFVSTFLHTIKGLFEKTTVTRQVTRADEEILKDKMFLIVEDNELNAEILTEMLSMEGAKSELAVNGKEAVRMFSEAEPSHYDMILMDVQMPVMNGYEATKAIRALDHPRAKNIPIVAMTANAFAEDVQNAIDAGMDGHLAKPIDMAKVKELIGKIFKERV